MKNTAYVWTSVTGLLTIVLLIALPPAAVLVAGAGIWGFFAARTSDRKRHEAMLAERRRIWGY